MRSANAQNNLEKSVVGVPLKYTKHDPLGLKERARRVYSGRTTGDRGTWASPSVTYCPSDDLIYYIGRDDSDNFGLCAFNAIYEHFEGGYYDDDFSWNLTERVCEFDKKSFDYETDLSGDISSVGHFHYLKYSIPRDLVFSHFDNAIYILFHEHTQTYKIQKFTNPGGGYTGFYYLHSVNSETKFVLKKFDIDKRSITLSNELFAVTWEDYAEYFTTSETRQELLEPTLGRTLYEFDTVSKYFPPYLYYMFNSLSVNPRKGEIIVLHPEKGHGLQHIKSWTKDYAERFKASSAQELKTGSTTIKTGTVFDENGICKTARNCTEWEITPNMTAGGPFWYQGAYGTPWKFWAGEMGDVEGGDRYECDGAKDWAEDYLSWTPQDCDCCITLQDPEAPPASQAEGLAAQTGNVLRKLIYCPINDSFYNSSNFESTEIASIKTDGKQDFRITSGSGHSTLDVTGNNLRGAAATTGKVIDGIYIPTEKKLLYLSYQTQITACLVPPCPPPTDVVYLSYVSPGGEGYGKVGGLIYDEVHLSKVIPAESPESLVFCPSNNKIYIFAGGTILRVRVSDLVIEKSINISTFGVAPQGKSLKKAFIPIYSPINDVIYYVSTNEDVSSFVLDVNYH